MMAKVYITVDTDKMPEAQKTAFREILRAGKKDGWAEWSDKPVRSPRKARKSKTLTDTHKGMFEAFWGEFGLKKGRKEALEAWANIADLDDEFSAIMYAAKRECDERGAIIARGGTPKWAQGWITAERWKDFEEPPANVVKFKKDEAPSGWKEFWKEYTGKDCLDEWEDLTAGVRAEIMEMMRERKQG